MEKYSFHVDGLYGDITAEDAAKELYRVKDIYGELTPENLVEASKDKMSLFHNYFEWNDKRAAELYRLKQAKSIIRNICVEIVHENVEVKLRAFVNVQKEKNKPRELVPITEAIHNENAYRDLLKQAKEEMYRFVSIYSQIIELNEVKAAMLKTLSELKNGTK